MLSRPKRATVRPSPSPGNWGCARWWPIATSALVCCLPRSVDERKPGSALSAAIALYRAMDMTFWLPQAEATLVEVEGC